MIRRYRRSVITLAALVLAAPSGRALAERPNRVVVLQGTAEGELRVVEGVEMDCFDTPMVNPRNGHVIGTATDCLDLASVVPIGDDGGFGIDNTTFFHFHNGTVAAASRTTIQPVEDPSEGPTHITGEVSAEDNVLPHLGTGPFAGRTGRTRLSGIVDMSALGSNVISFDCVFVIDLD